MAMAWIARIINHRKETYWLSQNDPTYHPVIGGRQFKNQAITVGPNYDQAASWFAIPWAGSGELHIGGGYVVDGGSEPAHQTVIKYDIGPSNTDGSNDYLRMRDGEDRQTYAAKVGPRGPGFSASMDLVLVFNDDGIVWNVQNSNQIGADILAEFLEIVENNAGAALGALLTPK